MLKQFQRIVDEMAELEKMLLERERFHAATQIKVLRGFVTAIMLATM